MDGFNNLFAQAPSYLPGLLSEEEIARLQQESRQAGLVNLGLSLLSSAGPSPQRQGLGQMLAQGVMAGQQASRNAYEQAVKDKMLQQQLAEQQQARQEALAARQILPTLIRQPRQEIYGEDIMGQRVGEGVKLGAPELDVASLAKLFATAPGVATKVLPSVEAFRKLTELQQFDLPEGTTRYGINRETGKPEVIAGGPKPQVAKPAGEVLEAMQVLGINVPVEQLTEAQRKSIRAYIDRKDQDRSQKVSVNLNDPTAVSQAQLKTMNQWEGYLKDSGDAVVANRASAFYDAYRQATQEGNVAADGAMIYNLAKVYDQTGAVQQGDVNTIIGNRSIPTQIQLFAQKLQKGGTFTPQERQNLKKIVDGIVTERGNALESVLEQYQNVNRQLGGSPGAIRNPYATVRRPRKSLDELTGGQ